MSPAKPKAAPAPTVPTAAKPLPRPSGPEIAAWILAGVGLLLILKLHLLAALLGGLAVYELVHLIASKLRFLRSGRGTRKILAATLLAAVVVTVLILSVFGVVAFFRGGQGNLPALLGKMADVLDTSKDQLPPWLADQLPDNAEEIKNLSVAWLRTHAGDVKTFGADLGRTFLHVLVGMILGALVSLNETRGTPDRAPLAQALTERADRLGDAFRRIVFAQARISALNTALTALYLLVVLPLLGVHLPFTKTLLGITFVAGLLPVVGNLISNTVIVIVSLSYSLGAALGSMIFLLVIHKLEYFVNAKIIGTEIKASAWELLLAMLVMESAFGLSGVIAAPIYYAFLKTELTDRGLI
ncbi:MAG TPA: AI-2E family transporter [Thermoanaerobaculia bacterium]|nr:AI-2E family transporter [Thermoanaerobaculia bacterium]